MLFYIVYLGICNKIKVFQCAWW